ncbi:MULTISPECIES: PqiC family protein [unclassified Acinetobacter]|uniref:PqiC family protein n=1 Tax=unclassified Acinetobacter TaxID=196816 RepID=UPI0029352CF6|nr:MULTISPECIES: PqiC family protein [unclassified Acinetobacter]WOE32883.1 PqiC family protein [Acinetobacter sp. SAAs470]WOE38360.1 PqiC family protein [Acinetobacter sp. SAAs474]
MSPQFYTLTPKLTPLASSPVKLIEVLPVGLPQRLDTSLMVLQKSNGVSYMLDQQRWTSSLSDELHSGLSAGLQQKLGAIDVYQNGLTGGKTWYTIATEFSRFDIVEHADKAATDIEVMAAWVIKRHDASPNKLSQGQYPHQLSCRMNFKNSVDSGKDFVDIVKSYQNSLNRVIDAIAISTLAVDTKQQPAIEGVICF